MINCLNGFDELVQINISKNEQIGQIIILVKEQLESQNMYNLENHKETVKKELLERGYQNEIINMWINHVE